ncbi:hypothetical protein [Xanthomonas sp. 60]
MKAKYLSASVAAALALATMSPAYAMMPVFDAANYSANTTTAVSTTLIAVKMHGVLEALGGEGSDRYGKEINFWDQSIHNDEVNNEYNELNQQYNTKNLYHSEVNTNYLVENNYYCNIGSIGEGGGDNGSVSMLADEGSGQVCHGEAESGTIVIPIPVAYGVGKFGAHDEATAYMDQARGALADVGAQDTTRLTTVMDGNAMQAAAVDSQTADFENQSKRLKTLASQATSNMGSRMQAVYANQIAAAQTGEMMQMRALMLADQNAQLLRAQESASLEARQSAAESRLRAAPVLSQTASRSW